MASVDRVVDQVARTGEQAVVVSQLHSHADPAQEEALGRRLRERFPFVPLSHQINPEE